MATTNPAHSVIEAFTQRGETVAVCESLTAGLCSATLATVPGASAVLRGGFITYATELKHDLARVPWGLIEEFGVVSPQCAQAMALGAREQCSATWGIALTGVAGPDSQEGHPAGVVFLGIAGPGGAYAVRAGGEAGLHGNRDEIRHQAVVFALEEVLAASDKHVQSQP